MTPITDLIIEKITNPDCSNLKDEIIIISSFNHLRLGIDYQGSPYLFFNSTLSSRKYGNTIKIGFHGEFFQKLDLYDNEGNLHSNYFDVLKITGNNQDEIIFTLRMMAQIIDDLARDYSSEKLKTGLDRISKIFKNRTTTTNTSIQGFVGELLFLLNAENIVETYLGWHVVENQKLDFIIHDYVFEIKTSRGNRIILVEYNQIFNSFPLEQVNIVSYNVNGSGQDDLLCLMYKIFERLPEEYKYEFEENFYTAIGDKIIEIPEFKFDISIVSDSIRIINATELPLKRIEELHRSITSIKYSIDIDKM
jgi:hypothetical protein